MSGTLYLVATPIGNLGDITLRALETLRTVDVIAAEDTRKTGNLLRHFEISKPQVAYHEHNERQTTPRLIQRLLAGENIAVVTNAGTPGISDPGFVLVRAAIAEDIVVTVIPGPAAVVGALVISGLPVHAFTFRGFPPRKSAARQRFFAADVASPYTLIYYESVYRIVPTLTDALAVFGDRPAALVNDLTKLYETVWRGSLSDVLARAQAAGEGGLKGEYVLLIGGADGQILAVEPADDDEA